MEHRRLVIIGSGAAGWTAALYAARAGLKPLVVAGIQPGGQLTITDDVENYPGFPDPIGGPELMARMEEQALRYGTEVAHDTVVRVDFDQYPYVLEGEEHQWKADSVIIATGAAARWLGVKGEEAFMGRGVSACATCDGHFYRGKEVAVVGGGNTAVEEALYLSNLCSKVHLIHRRDSLKAERILQDRLLGNPKIEVHWNRAVAEIAGTEGLQGGVTHVVLDRTDGDGPQEELRVDGVFAAIGHDPATAVFRGQVDLDDHGYVRVTPGTTRTGKKLLHAAGDVADPHWRQAVTAAGMGCMAALDIERTLAAETA